MIVEDLLVRIRAEVDSRVDDLPVKIDDITDALGNLALAAAAALLALTQFADGVAQDLRQVERLADGMSIGVEGVQELSSALGFLGVDSDHATDALATLTDRARDAQDGMQSFVDDFALVGIGVEDLRDKDPIELFEEFTRASGESADANARVAAAVRIFGDDLGRRLIPVLAGGTEALERLHERAEAAGLVIGEDLVRRSARFADRMDSLRARAEGLRLAIGARLVPALEPLLDEMENLAESSAPFTLAATERAAEALRMTLQALSTPLGRVVALIGVGLGGAAAVRAAGSLMAIVGAAGPAGAALAAMGSALGASLLAMAPYIAALAAVVLGAVELKRAMNGEDSVVTSLADTIGVGEEANRMFRALGDTLKGFAGFVDASFTTSMNLAADAIRGLAEAAGDTVVGGVLTSIADFLQSGAGEMLTSLAESLERSARGFSLASRYLSGDDSVAVMTGADTGRQATTRGGRAFDVARATADALPLARGAFRIAQNVTIQVTTGAMNEEELARQIQAQLDGAATNLYQGGY